MQETGMTIQTCAKRMTVALATLRRGATPEAREAAVRDVAGAIGDACCIPSMTWHDAQSKAKMAEICLKGRNAVSARRIVASLARDLENLPPKGAPIA